ncbi:MAG: gephyrin-like molybdotransferase Glp [Chloroflexota bacterium]
MKLLSVRAAQRRITRNLSPVGTEKVSLAHGLGRVLATDVRSTDLPLFDNSSVDGFAVVAEDLESASIVTPRRLNVVADIPAGTISRIRLKSGEAARIMTGAPIPRNATAVIMVEDTDCANRPASAGPPEWISAYQRLTPGTNIRRRGTDVRRGHRVLTAGRSLRSQDLGLLAMLGMPEVRVHRRPRVGLLSSGNELSAPGRPLRPGGIRDANSTTLAALIVDTGCDVIRLGVARDTERAIKVLLERAIPRRADIVVSSAGVSVGALDLMRAVLQERGQLHFWRVDARPGKPLAVGEYRGVPYVGLPGNPVSAFVGFELFVRPALARLAGLKAIPRRNVRVILAEPVESDGRESYLRAVVAEREGTYVARLTGHQGSSNLLSLVQANALLMVPAGVKSLAVGDQADAWLL